MPKAEDCFVCFMMFGLDKPCTCSAQPSMPEPSLTCPNCPGLIFTDQSSLSFHSNYCKKSPPPPPLAKRGATLRNHPYARPSHTAPSLASRCHRLKSVNQAPSSQPDTDELSRLLSNFSADTGKEKIYKCTYCQFQTKNKSPYVDHLKTHFPPGTVFCYGCTRMFSIASEFPGHICIPHIFIE